MIEFSEGQYVVMTTTEKETFHGIILDNNQYGYIEICWLDWKNLDGLDTFTYKIHVIEGWVARKKIKLDTQKNRDNTLNKILNK